MDKENADTPNAPREHWNNSGPRPGQAFEALREFHRKIEGRLRNRFTKKYPDMSCNEVEVIVAMEMLAMCENQPEKFFAHLPTASAENAESTMSTGPPQPADDLAPTLLANMVKWKI